jgi:putative regulatory protein, FmdB family
MPVYVYRNLTTGDTFEVEQRISEEALTVHPESGDPVKRIVQPVGIAFKGSGFYVNDSRSSGTKNTTSKPSGDAAAKPSASAEGSSEAKPAEKPSASKDAAPKVAASSA